MKDLLKRVSSSFALKLMIGATSVILITSIVGMLLTFSESQKVLREDFAATSEDLAIKVADNLSLHSSSPEETCRTAKDLYDGLPIDYLSVNENSKPLCTFGTSKRLDLDLSNPETARAELEKSRIFTTYASVECQKRENCKPYDIEMGQDFSRLDRNLDIIWLNLVRNSAAIVISNSIFLMIFSFFIRSRLLALSLACDTIKSGHSNLKLNISGSDEISKVAIALQKLNDDLQESERDKEKQRISLLATSKLSALGEMAGGVAHEINNPLGTIQLLSSQIQDLLQEEPLDKSLIEERLKKILKTVVRITKIINGLRTFSRDSSNDPFEVVPIAPLVEEALSLCAERLKSHGVLITSKVSDERLTFFGNGTEISQVLVNLLNNASDAVSKLPEKWIQVSTEELNDEVRVSVTDSGSNVPEDVKARLFQPFFTTKEIGKGTGLKCFAGNSEATRRQSKTRHRLREHILCTDLAQNKKS